MKNIDKNDDELLKELVKIKVQKIRQFYIHAFIYGIGVIVYVLKTYYNVLNFPPINFINFTAMAIWTFFLVEHGLPLFFKDTFFGRNWEKKKIAEILERDKEIRNTLK